MLLFIKKISIISFLLIIFLLILLYCIPKDENAYLCEYNDKIKIIERTPSPRLIFIGSSCIAFNIDSKQISDNLGIRTINMGLMGGIGARYYLDDFIQYIKKDDIVIISPSYQTDFVKGGFGTPSSIAELMICTNWRNFTKLEWYQMWNVVEGIPYLCYRNIIRLFRLPFNKFSSNSPKDNYEFKYVASGFNRFGDESSHWSLPYKKEYKIEKKKPIYLKANEQDVNKNFCIYLKNVICEYERKGAIVLLMPEISSQTTYLRSNPDKIANFIKYYALSFFISPQILEFNDSLGYDAFGGAHFNRKGVTIVSERISNLLKQKFDLQTQMNELN